MIIIRWLPQLSSITPSYNFPRRSGGFYPWKSFLLAGINIFPISTSTLPFMSHWLRVEPGGVSFPEHMLPQTYTQLACCSQNTRVKQLLRDQASDISLTQDLWIYPAPKLVPGTVLMLKEEKKKRRPRHHLHHLPLLLKNSFKGTVLGHFPPWMTFSLNDFFSIHSSHVFMLQTFTEQPRL